MINLSSSKIKDLSLQHLIDCRRVLLGYLKNPMEQIGSLPNWNWARIIVTQVALTAICGLLRALVASNGLLGLISGTLANPILTVITSFVSAAFFYYSFQIFANKTVEFRKLYELIFFANIPFYFFLIIVSYVPPIFLVGFAFTGLLLFKGFIQHFELQRKLVTRLISTLFIVLLSLWIWQRMENLRSERAYDSVKIKAPEIKLGE